MRRLPHPWWVAGAGGAAGLVGALLLRSSGYAPAPEGRYGPVWKTTRPPGLPEGVRAASAGGAAERAVEQAAEREVRDTHFVDAVVRLAWNESGARFGLPANNFDARCQAGHRGTDQRLCTFVDGARPTDKPLITAWGVFNWNRDAWRFLTGSRAFPWEASVRDEVAKPIRQYGELWRALMARAKHPLAAARGVHLWHRSPAAYSHYLDALKRTGYGTAWREAVAAEHRSAVDANLA